MGVVCSQWDKGESLFPAVDKGPGTSVLLVCCKGWIIHGIAVQRKVTRCQSLFFRNKAIH